MKQRIQLPNGGEWVKYDKWYYYPPTNNIKPTFEQIKTKISIKHLIK